MSSKELLACSSWLASSSHQLGMFSSAHKALYTQLTGHSESRKLGVQTVFSGVYCQEYTLSETGNFLLLLFFFF